MVIPKRDLNVAAITLNEITFSKVIGNLNCIPDNDKIPRKSQTTNNSKPEPHVKVFLVNQNRLIISSFKALLFSQNVK